MTEGSLPARPISPQERDRAVQRLCTHFASDHLEMRELERRLDLAYAAKGLDELEALESDLPALAETVLPDSPPLPQPPVGPVVDTTRPLREREFIGAVMGGTERKGPWTPARQITALAVMGGLELDFRDATFATPVTTVTVFSLMGGADIIVPPGVHVESSGLAIMGAWERAEPGGQPSPNAPVIRVNGFAMMGAVEITERKPGESAREARKRIKAERKARARLQRGRGRAEG